MARGAILEAVDEGLEFNSGKCLRVVSIADLKNNLSRENEVLRGGEVVIKGRNNPIARIVPLATGEDDAAELMELIASRIAMFRKNDDPHPKSFWSEPLPKR